MKAFLLIIGILVGQTTFAAEMKVTCDEAKKLDRSDSIKKLEFIVGGKTPRLGCSVAVKDSFCGSIRMDNSWFVNGAAIDSCERGNKDYRQVYNFVLGQEDELDNFVTLTVFRSCKTNEVDPAHISAIISENQSGDLPESAQVVACSGLAPSQVRK